MNPDFESYEETIDLTEINPDEAAQILGWTDSDVWDIMEAE
jgi:hypothetical protein